VQVQAVSNLNMWTDLNPECTFFQQEYCRCTPFAISETDITPSGGAPQWGRLITFEIPRAGDLLGATFLKINRNGLRLGSTAANAYPAATNISFVNMSGYAAINYVQLEIGSIQVDKLSGTFLGILEQHRASVGNEQGVSIGDFQTLGGGGAVSLAEWSWNDQFMYIALHFFFFEHPEMYLPIIALSAHGVRIKVQLNTFSQMVNATISGVATDPTTIATASSAAAGFAWTGWATGFDGQINDVSLTVRMVFLDQFERNLVSAEVHELLTLQHQEDFFATSIAINASNYSTILSFNNAIMAMFVVYQLTSATNSSNFAEKDFFNFSVLRPGMGLTVAPYDEQPPAIAALAANAGLTKTPIAAWRLTFNGQDRVALRESEYFTQVTPFLHSVKKSYDLSVLSYYWHLAPLSDYQMFAGAANFSRMHEVKSQGVFAVAGFTTAASAAPPAAATNPFYTSGGSILVQQRGTAGYDTGAGSVGHFVMSYNVGRISHGQYVMKFA
jgi:hypothetical protein